ncbi:MAG: DUF2997 domain-containing protein [Promethearchaeota archaeon]|jgi:hypothetical protein
MKEIEVTIDVDGKTEIDLKGFQGKGCSQVTDGLIKSLEGEVITRDQKGDFWKPKPKTKVKQRQAF